ncbi:hypothetical protein BGZ76_006035 [Entomortierella beljakovae]|nr:hypothetical protein BGZ76_006035 [Entomortierella beljakovae]
MNGDRLLDQQEGQSDGVNDKSNHIGQRWPGRLNDTKNQKDVITIAYIPSISDSEPFQLPELAHLGGGPHASFLDEEYDKHVSIASSLSTGTLDEAVVLAMNIKATPKLLKLNTIKENSDMIKRSNSLHSSNSIKRSQSQRKPIVRRIQKEENHKAGTSGDSTGMGPQDSSHEDNQQDQQQYTPAVMVTGPSARSSAQSEVSAKRKPRPPNMVLEPRPLHPSYHINQNPSTSNATPLKKLTTSKSTPIALPSTLTAMTNTILSPVSTSSSRSLPTKESEHARYSEEILENGERRGSWSAVANETGIHSDKAILNSPPRPFTRSSTFSTQSDARSTTTGEEIMIFWDGHRDSRSSDSIHSKWMT